MEEELYTMDFISQITHDINPKTNTRDTVNKALFNLDWKYPTSELCTDEHHDMLNNFLNKAMYSETQLHDLTSSNAIMPEFTDIPTITNNSNYPQFQYDILNYIETYNPPLTNLLIKNPYHTISFIERYKQKVTNFNESTNKHSKSIESTNLNDAMKLSLDEIKEYNFWKQKLTKIMKVAIKDYNIPNIKEQLLLSNDALVIFYTIRNFGKVHFDEYKNRFVHELKQVRFVGTGNVNKTKINYWKRINELKLNLAAVGIKPTIFELTNQIKEQYKLLDLKEIDSNLLTEMTKDTFTYQDFENQMTLLAPHENTGKTRQANQTQKDKTKGLTNKQKQNKRKCEADEADQQFDVDDYETAAKINQAQFDANWRHQQQQNRYHNRGTNRYDNDRNKNSSSRGRPPSTGYL